MNACPISLKKMSTGVTRDGVAVTVSLSIAWWLDHRYPDPAPAGASCALGTILELVQQYVYQQLNYVRSGLLNVCVCVCVCVCSVCVSVVFAPSLVRHKRG
jgi:hypothetical protein